MSTLTHTLGPTCVYHGDEGDDIPRDNPDVPYLKAQFFYASAIPIDDPLSPLPPLTSDPKPAYPNIAQPFSPRDNSSLAEAWQGIEHHSISLDVKHQSDLDRPELGERGRSLGELIRFPRFKADGRASTASSKSAHANPASTGKENVDHTSTPSPDYKARSAVAPPSLRTLSEETEDTGLTETTSFRSPKPSSRRNNGSESQSRYPMSPTDASAPIRSPSTPLPTDGTQDQDISGQPFARTPILSPGLEQVGQNTSARGKTSRSQQKGGSDGSSKSRVGSKRSENRGRHKEEDGWKTSGEEDEDQALIPVGLSRLHLVELPAMLMKPIYWSPVNDVAAVIRATWFYANTMLPVEPDLANWLEIGYEEMKPWTETWQDELNSCVEIGAEAEMKVAYCLFPDQKTQGSRPKTATEAKPRDKGSAAEAQILESATIEHENKAAGPRNKQLVAWPSDSSQRFKNHRVIFVDGRKAQILRPSLAPSASRNRKPLAAVRKGREIGVAVVRGFNRHEWDKLHPPAKMSVRAAHAKVGAFLSQSGTQDTEDQNIMCPACRFAQQRTKPRVSDLVLVIHGIGQKLSEKMDSFHFTHAINSFRREVNVELSKEVVQGTIRKEQRGIMVLPVNWRLTVSFDETADNREGEGEDQFGLEDITPETLPAIRSLISDVMLDIPYYLSHHKDKMIAAVVREANRVYRLWCRNNPDFLETGRVHLIAHSLGAAMALDILSHQPNKPSMAADANNSAIDEKFFEFDTKSLFTCGSPAGFFLLLNKANLVPRRGRRKPGVDEQDESGITGEAGNYGCLAVDNIYNVMAPYDPITYRMNATVDMAYAASLKPALIPSVRQGLLASLGLRWASSSPANVFGSPSNTQRNSSRPQMKQLPSTIEMNTHNFTREELAERRMFLLNDNGQIDFTLSTDGGPLDFQYWSMLSAHSSYWLRPDFVRFLVVEIGRTQGRQGTLAALVAQKKRVFKAGKLS